MSPRPRRALLVLAAALAVAAIAPAVAGAATIHLVQGEQTVAVKRPGTTLPQAIAALIAGPTRAEIADGFRTYPPAGTVVRSLTQTAKVATIDFEAGFAEAETTEELTARV